MHSLKNTIVAVGLLGVSFLFYQASSRKSPDTGGMTPALEIAETLEADIAIGSTNQPTSSPAPLKTGEFSPAPEAATTGSAKIKANRSQLPTLNSTNDFAAEFSIKSPPHESSSTRGSAPTAEQFTADMNNALSNQPIPGDNSNSFAGTADPGTSSSGQAISSAERDANLISALSENRADDRGFTSSSDFEAQSMVRPKPLAQPKTGLDSSNDFGSQSIPAGGNAFNQLAGVEHSKNRDSEVRHADTEPDLANLNFQAAWPHVDSLVNEENYRDALRLLSRYYRSTDLTGPQRQRLIGWLDALAGKVIFSDEHHLHSMPYTLGNETLVDLGQRWNVPAQLIFNINQNKIPNPAAVASGTQLKVIDGPFDAEIDTKQKTMTLFLDDLYAGRFPVSMGISGNPQPGSYQVLVKSEAGHNWRDAEGKIYPPGSPENGYGPHWIGLSGKLCIHAVGESTREGHHGCIGLSSQDSKDVFAILSVGSTVKILR